MNSNSLSVEPISDTAFVLAAYRAWESDRPDSLFKDPYAHILAGERGYKLVEGIPGGKAGVTGCALRTVMMDELILHAVKEQNVNTVVNLGAGLDTRPYRLPLPSSLCWYECDLPVVLDYKAEKLAGVEPNCVLESVALDLTDTAARQKFFQSVGMDAKRVLAIADGLLIYLTATQVAALATDLYARPQFQWWLTQLSSPEGLRNTQKTLSSSADFNQLTPQFAPEEGAEFFRQYGWIAAQQRWFLDEAERWHREVLPPPLLAQLKTPEDWKFWREMVSAVLLKRH